MDEKVKVRTKVITKDPGLGGLWFLGFIGALVYYIHFHSGSLWLVLVAIFKAVFWPAYLVYHLLLFLHM